MATDTRLKRRHPSPANARDTLLESGPKITTRVVFDTSVEEPPALAGSDFSAGKMNP